uniref:Rho-GAP domain-containing protein n=2 Tax=Plectus sambesii TaxID=2011161 RepID=A0A914UQC2_9BILA
IHAHVRVAQATHRDCGALERRWDAADGGEQLLRSAAMTVTTLGYNMVICGHSDDLRHRYRGRIEKVKFGVPIQEAFSHDIPATLLVLLLKVNKEGPIKKDIWRAPGNQAQVRKLAHVMQHGRLVNIANFSVYTAASVIKKFLSKLPGGIFGLENETRLFAIVEQEDPEKQRELFCR